MNYLFFFLKKYLEELMSQAMAWIVFKEIIWEC